MGGSREDRCAFCLSASRLALKYSVHGTCFLSDMGQQAFQAGLEGQSKEADSGRDG